MKINFQHIKQCPGVAKLLDIFIISITFHKCLDEITAISRCKYLLDSFLLLDLYLISDLRFVVFFLNYVYTFAPCSLLIFVFKKKIILTPPPFFYWSQFICPHTSEVLNFITTPVCMPSCSISIHHIA